MSNRSLAFLILVWICGLLIWVIYYFFVANVWSVIFYVDWPKLVNIEVSWEFSNTYNVECANKCYLSKIPPVNYKLKIKKEWYKNYSQEFKLSRWEIKEINIKVEKEVIIENISATSEIKIKTIKYKKYLEEKKAWWEELTRNNIWDYLWNLYSYSNEKWFLNFFVFDWNTEEEVFNLEWINTQNVNLNSIDWIIIYSSKDWNYFYNLDNKTNYENPIKDDIYYIKKTSSQDKFIVDWKMWVYIYNSTNNDYTKNTLYDDFIMLENSKIIWLIKSKSKDKISILNFNDNWKNKLILHDINTQERKVLYETTQNIEHLFYKDWVIKYVDENGQLYNLKELNIN